jgi:hypothetical protein
MNFGPIRELEKEIMRLLGTMDLSEKGVKGVLVENRERE